METKKKLRVDINRLFTAVSLIEHELDYIRDRLKALEEKEAERADIITGKEAAKMLGYNYEYVSSTWLGKVGIVYTKGENGSLQISRKSLEGYLNARLKTEE